MTREAQPGEEPTMTERESENRYSRGCVRSLVGCLVVAVVAMTVAAILVYVNFDRIAESEFVRGLREKVEESGEAFSDMLALREAVRARFEARDVGIRWHHSGGKRYLVVNLLNPVVPGGEGADRQEYARSVALFTTEQTADIEGFEAITVVLARSTRVGVTVNTTQSYMFPVSELLAPKDEGAP